MGRRRRQIVLVVASCVAALLVLYPPWRAQGIRTTVRYAAVPGVAPATLIDTIQWTLALSPLYAPPRAALGGERIRALATKALAGDVAAGAELRRATGPYEDRYHVPEVLRADGALWRDSVLARAGIPSVTSYDLSFVIDQRWLAARLIVLAALALLAIRRFAGAANPESPSARRD